MVDGDPVPTGRAPRTAPRNESWRVRPTDQPARRRLGELDVLPTPGLSAVLRRTTIDGMSLGLFAASPHRAVWAPERQRRAVLTVLLSGSIGHPDGSGTPEGTLIVDLCSHHDGYRTVEPVRMATLWLPDSVPPHLTAFLPPLLVPPEDRSPLVACFVTLLEALTRGPIEMDAGGAALARGASALALAVLSETVAARRTDPAARALFTAWEYIEQHLADPALGPADVAAGAGVSTRSLQELFREEGTSVARAIRDRRLSLAAWALRHEADAPGTAALAERVGFAGPDQFTRAFRGRYGLAPGAYRTGGAA